MTALGTLKEKVRGRRKKGRIERNWQNIPINCLALSLELYTSKWNVAVTNFHTHPPTHTKKTQNFDASQKWTKSKDKREKKKWKNIKKWETIKSQKEFASWKTKKKSERDIYI